MNHIFLISVFEGIFLENKNNKDWMYFASVVFENIAKSCQVNSVELKLMQKDAIKL